MSARDRETVEALARFAAALDGAVLGLGTAALAATTVVKYLATSKALRRIAEAPSASVLDLRYSLLAGTTGEPRLAVVRGVVRAVPRVGKILIPPGSGEHSVITKHTQTLKMWREASLDREPALAKLAEHAVELLARLGLKPEGPSSFSAKPEVLCIFSEWRGIFGWTFDLHALFFKSLKEQITTSFRWVPFVLADSGPGNSTGMVHVKFDGANAANQSLPLTTVYHKLIPVEQNQYTLFQTLVGNGYPIALLDEEKILPIGKEITAIGLCRVNDGSIEIKSCPELPFFLTELTKDGMEAELSSSARTLFWASVVLGTVSVGLLGHAIYRCWQRMKLHREAIRAQERFHDAEEEDDTREDDNSDDEPGAMGDGQLCVICLRKRRKTAFIPCGHLVCCCACAKRVELMPEPLCPVCRQDISYMLRVYDS